ncbi:MAG: hypothetical protein ACRCW2_00280 [Cellulosilyticaceae bacterium]
MKKYISAYIGALLILALYIYTQLPVFRTDFISFYVVLAGFFGLVGFLAIGKENILSLTKFSSVHFGLAALLALFVIVVPFITSTPFLHADAYRSLIGDVTESDFSSDMAPVSVEDIRLVDMQTAIRLGDKKLGEVPGLGSVSKLGEFSIQSVNGKLYWVAPLVHRDAVKWLTNLGGTTGYIKVSATNPQDVAFVQSLNGEPVKIIYQPDAYFHQDLARHVYLNGNFNVGLTDFTFEIDDEGVPYWVVSLYEHAIGFSGAEAVGIATVNATTGEVNRYGIADAPTWVDRIQPEQFVSNQIRNWGVYVKGYLNSVIAETDVLVPTPGTTLVYGSDGNAYWYTGITSSGADESTIGYMLVNSRSKEAKLYKQPGATELAAMRSAEGKVQQMNYKATFPVMYNILGTPTYVMSLKDKADLIKMVAFVSVEDYSLLGLGETKEVALRSYKEALKSKGNDIQIGNQTETSTLEGIVTRIATDVQNGQTYYYLLVDTAPELAFIMNSSLSKEIPLSQVGDSVHLTYDRYDSQNVDVLSFDNKDLVLQ